MDSSKLTPQPVERASVTRLDSEIAFPPPNSVETKQIVSGKNTLFLRTARQVKIFRHIYSKGNFITSYGELEHILGIPAGTIKHTISKLGEHGYLTKRKHSGQNNVQGLHIQLDNSKRTDQLNSRIVQMDRSKPHSKISRENKKNISLSQTDLFPALSLTEEDLQINYPALFACGFRTNQIQQICTNLKRVGRNIGNLLLGMEYANAWLEIGNLLDGKKEKVAEPLNYIFKSLYKTGLFKRPNGYVFPEELAAKDAEARANAAKKAAEAKEEEEFQKWKMNLSSEEKDHLLKDRIGPLEAWLKHKFLDRHKLIRPIDATNIAEMGR